MENSTPQTTGRQRRGQATLPASPHVTEDALRLATTIGEAPGWPWTR
jgi:hypothetical protein